MRWGGKREKRMIKKPYALVALFLLCCSVITVISSRSYDYWYSNQPGPGFFPFWLGILLAVLSLILLFLSLKQGSREKIYFPNRAAFKKLGIILGTQLGFVIVINKLGFLITSALFLFTLFACFPKYRNLVNGILSICISALFYLLFQRWLSIPLPSGYFGF
jgi:hypothetical protein